MGQSISTHLLKTVVGVKMREQCLRSSSKSLGTSLFNCKSHITHGKTIMPASIYQQSLLLPKCIECT